MRKSSSLSRADRLDEWLPSVPLSHDDVGEGQNVIVFVHGHPFNRTMWRPQLTFLNGLGWRMLAPDLRGYGASSVVNGTTTLDLFAADIARLLDTLGIERVVIAGLSMGGQIAMEFCRSYRKRVRGLVLAATFPQAETPDGRLARSQMAARLLREGMEPYASDVLPYMLSAGTLERSPEVGQHVLAMMRKTNPIGAASALRGRAVRRSYDQTLASLDVPALIVVGSEDSFTTREDAERMQSLLAGSTLEWMPGIGHMPNLEAPNEFNATLSAFLRRVEHA